MSNKLANRMAAALLSHCEDSAGYVWTARERADSAYTQTNLFYRHNRIATYERWNNEQLRLFDCGYQTATTKRYLNAVLEGYSRGRMQLVQRNFEWYVIYTSMSGTVRTYRWYTGMTFRNGQPLPGERCLMDYCVWTSEHMTCEQVYNCCDCGIGQDHLGACCIYCWSCNACDYCKDKRVSDNDI